MGVHVAALYSTRPIPVGLSVTALMNNKKTAMHAAQQWKTHDFFAHLQTNISPSMVLQMG
jgi:hypothetical protein